MSYNIRAITSEDIPSVAEMVTNAYQRLRGRDVAIVSRALEEIIFQNPWAKGNPCSLVYENSEGEIIGFIGISPRSMKFRGQEITMAIFHNFVVKPGRGSELAGVRLLKTLFDGPHDLIVGDASDAALKQLWEAMGGTIGYSYSTDWNIPIRPIVHQFGANYLSNKFKMPFLSKALWPAMAGTEYLMGKIMGPPFRYEQPEGYTKELTTQELVQYQQKYSAPFALQPNYTPDNIQWILNIAEHANSFGKLECVGVFDSNDQILGWFIYYPNPGGDSKVLQMHAKDNKEGLVLDYLIYLSQKQGTVKLTGRLEPAFMGIFSKRYSRFVPGCQWLLLNGKNHEITSSLCSGDAFYSKLETDLWLF